MSAMESEEIVTPRINTVFNKFYGYNLAFGPFDSQFLNEWKIQIVKMNTFSTHLDSEWNEYLIRNYSCVCNSKLIENLVLLLVVCGY